MSRFPALPKTSVDLHNMCRISRMPSRPCTSSATRQRSSKSERTLSIKAGPDTSEDSQLSGLRNSFTFHIVFCLAESLLCECRQTVCCELPEISKGKMVLWLIDGVLQASRLD